VDLIEDDGFVLVVSKLFAGIFELGSICLFL
jgi:hypothetical protein